MDEEGITALHSADEIAVTEGFSLQRAEIYAELGYVDFLRARYDRAELSLNDSLRLAEDQPWITAKSLTYLGSVESDRAEYAQALATLQRAIEQAHLADDPRREIYATTMIGRLHLLRGDLSVARTTLEAAIERGERERWLAFLPWPQSFLGEVALAEGDIDEAESLAGQAFARACQLGDPCWEGASARALALVASHRGDIEGAFTLLADARIRCNRVADSYVWLDAYILDTLCALGLRHHHPNSGQWITSMRVISSRTAMREMTVRALLHAAHAGDGEAAEGAQLLAAGIDNPTLDHALSDLISPST